MKKTDSRKRREKGKNRRKRKEGERKVEGVEGKGGGWRNRKK